MNTVEFHDDRVFLIDQTRLPHDYVVVSCETYEEVAAAIKEMKVRGAPAIGVTAALGVALAAARSQAADSNELLAQVDEAIRCLRQTRPTAVNLFWALDQMKAVAQDSAGLGVDKMRAAIVEKAQAMARADEEANRRMGAFGAQLVPDQSSILTHCNAGALATVAYGTALGVIRAAHEMGKRVHVFVDETRPFLQGARLTAWELKEAGIPLTLITDNMAGHFISRGKVDLAIVGADRIASNGDVANKIGTYSVAVLCKENGVPFYVAAPLSTIDFSLPSGDGIPIEERNPEEVTGFGGVRTAPNGIAAAHPAFDVTPNRYVSAIVTELGIARPPYNVSLAGLARATKQETLATS